MTANIMRNVVRIDELTSEGMHHFYATMPFEVLSLTAKFLRNVKKDMLSLEGIRQLYVSTEEEPLDPLWYLPILDGRDTIARAHSRTGETGALVIRTLQRINFNRKSCQVLFLVPTSERAHQIYRIVAELCGLKGNPMHFLRSDKKVRCLICIGCCCVRDQIDRLREGQHIVIGTPGRVFNMVSKQHLRVDDVLTLVLDEADNMLSRGFGDQVYDIWKAIIRESLMPPPYVQVCLFSATMPPELLDMTTNFMKTKFMQIDELTLEDVRQFYIPIEKEEWKLDAVCDLCETLTITEAIIYCNTRQKVDHLFDHMAQRDFTVSTIYAEMDQTDRDLALREFRSCSILISNDLFSCGIDMPSLVINFDLPWHLENYMRRIGRSWQCGRKVVAINFVTHKDLDVLKDIENYYFTQIEELPMDIADMI